MSDGDNKTSGTDPVLLQMTATLAEIKTAQAATTLTLQKIQDDRRETDKLLVGLSKDMDQAKKDIEKRTHREETARLRHDVEDLAGAVAAKANSKMMWWVLGLIGSMFILVVGGMIKLVFLP